MNESSGGAEVKKKKIKQIGNIKAEQRDKKKKQNLMTKKSSNDSSLYMPVSSRTH